MARPPVNRPTGRKVTLYMLPDVEAMAKEIGVGNLSAGVGLAVRAYDLRSISSLAAKARKAKKAK